MSDGEMIQASLPAGRICSTTRPAMGCGGVTRINQLGSEGRCCTNMPAMDSGERAQTSLPGGGICCTTRLAMRGGGMTRASQHGGGMCCTNMPAMGGGERTRSSMPGEGICCTTEQAMNGGDMTEPSQSGRVICCNTLPAARDDEMTQPSLHGGGIRCNVIPDVEEKSSKKSSGSEKHSKKEDEDNPKGKDNPEDGREDNPEDMKTAQSDKTGTTVESSHTAAWTPVRVRKVKLGVDRNLGLSPKSLKDLKVGNYNSKTKMKLSSGKVKDMKLLFEGALQTQTKANSLSNPYVTNLTAAQDKLLGGVYHVGQLYSMEVCDWTAGQAAGKTRANTAN